jgi:hypothetical protein
VCARGSDRPLLGGPSTRPLGGMLSAKYRRRFVWAALLLLPPALVTSCVLRDHLLEKHFKEVTPGMTPQQVVGVMGRPLWDDRCGAKMPTGLPNPCDREMGYRATLAPLDPTYYLIWFGSDGNVIDTAPISSP